jgi:hypothetical protein
MTDRIEPALTAEEWKQRIVGYLEDYEDGVPYVKDGEFGVGGDTYFGTVNPVQAIALANAALPDDDPRKITREWVIDIRDIADSLAGEIAEWVGDSPRTEAQIARLRGYADALESYLPPETP